VIYETDLSAAMDVIYEEYAQVPVLAELAAGRPPVRGCGPLDSPFVVVGEAPGETEERLGRPFAGRSGQLLQELFTFAGLPWNLCYVTNAVCWRPPGNRTPYPYQVQASQERLGKETALAHREVIVAAGGVAWRCLTAGRAMPAFEEARLKWHDLDGTRLLAIPHPAFILRLMHDRQAWEQRTIDMLSQALAPA